MGQLYGENCMILTSTVFGWSTRVTDRQADRRTDEIAMAYMLSLVKTDLYRWCELTVDCENCCTLTVPHEIQSRTDVIRRIIRHQVVYAQLQNIFADFPQSQSPSFLMIDMSQPTAHAFYCKREQIPLTIRVTEQISS